MFEPQQLAAMDDAGYNGIREEHIEHVANSLLATGLTEIDRSTFDYHCHKCGVDPNNFTQANLDRLQEKLNGQVTRMCKEKIDYIDFEDFVNNAGVKESTIKRRYKKIPGIIKIKSGFRVISGTRYPYNIGNTNIEDSASKQNNYLSVFWCLYSLYAPLHKTIIYSGGKENVRMYRFSNASQKEDPRSNGVRHQENG